MGESVYTASLSQQISYSIYLHRISIQHLAFPDLESLIRNRLFFFTQDIVYLSAIIVSLKIHFPWNKETFSLLVEDGSSQRHSNLWRQSIQQVQVLRGKESLCDCSGKNGGLHLVSPQQERRVTVILESSYIMVVVGACAKLQSER